MESNGIMEFNGIGNGSKINFRSSREIMRAVLEGEVVPDEYNLLESYCFLSIRGILDRFNKGEITKDTATRNKANILGDYEANCKVYKMYEEVFYESIRRDRQTAESRKKLKEVLGDKESPIKDADLAGALSLALDVIYGIFPDDKLGGLV